MRLLAPALFALAGLAVPAAADPVQHGCTLVASNGVAFSHAPSFHGVLAASIAEPTAHVEIRCSVRVDGVEHAAVVAGGPGAAAIADVVSFWMDPGDVVLVCTEANTSGGFSVDYCDGVTVQQAPPPAAGSDAETLLVTYVPR